MSESNETRTAAWHMPEQFPSAKNAMFRAADKIDALAARVAELEAAQANQADSLRHWSDLWNHIVTRLGSVDELPTVANFDALLLPWALD